MLYRFLTILIGLALACGAACHREKSGPETIHLTAEQAELLPLAQRVSTLERYVTFRRHYESLDVRHIQYMNNGEGLAPGPSDWDIFFVAQVPQEELEAWVPEGGSPGEAPDWLDTLPEALRPGDEARWYLAGSVSIGIDATRRLIVYRNATR